MAWLSLGFFIAAFIPAYWFLIRPLLKQRPKFSDFYARSDSFWAAVRMKLNTIKTKLAVAVGMIASILVGAHDFLIPIATGIEWTPVTSKVPPAVWPFVSMSYLALISYFRTLTTRTQEVEIAAVVAGATPAQAAVIAEKEPA